MPLFMRDWRNKMIEIGRICVKLAGRDAGGKCVIVDVLDNNYVLIDGNVRRRKCNIFHLEPTSEKVEIKKGASHEEVKKEFGKLKLPVWETKKKEKTERPRKQRGKKKKAEVIEEKKKPKKEVKKEKKPIDAKVVSLKKEEGLAKEEKKKEEKKQLKKEKKKDDKKEGKK